MNVKTASLYIRRSKPSVDGETVSLDFQEHELRELLTRHGAEVVSIYTDDGKSGNNLRRAEWLRWIESAAKVDIIATWALDRSARANMVLSGAPVIEAIKAHNTRLLTVRDSLDSESANFDLEFGIRGLLAHEDWKAISARNKATRAAKKRKGEWVGIPPFGTEIRNKVLMIKEDEAALVRDAASRILRGDAIAATTRWLNSTGARTRRGNEWARNSLIANLTSESVLNLGILDLATYRAVEKALHPRKGGGNGRVGGRPPAGLLSGLARCASCGGKVYLYRYTDAPRVSPEVYRCATRAKGMTCLEPGRIAVSDADDAIEAEFLSPPHADAFWFDERIEIVGGTLDAAQRALEAANEALVAEKTMENFLAAQAAEEAVLTATPGERRRTLVPLGTYGERWKAAEGDLHERRRLVADAVDEIRIGKGGVLEVDWTHEREPNANE